MGAAQIIYLVFTALGLITKAGLDGKETTVTHSFAAYFVVKLIAIALLFWGGFFGGGGYGQN